ncbi:MAG: hypothetical protein RMJ51_04955 [Candidatus Calescibacterium sp.]|nr:hypothetical protein [Candidatus Calescibacterium sp.]MCX7972539.1 hypothetical protein [bacterium]MDW8195568.1 hypothetical protein [Candidatus Calescibacterium sp.]
MIRGSRLAFLFLITILSITSAGKLYKIPSIDDIEAYYLNNHADSNCLIVCSIHGNEPVGYQLMNKLLFYHTGNYFPQDFNYCIVLQPSRYRILNNRRNNFEGLDPNRTFINLFSNSSFFIVSVIKKYKPIFIIDIHQARRENVDFMYGFGNYCKIINNLYKVDELYGLSRTSIYNSTFYSLKKLQEDLEIGSLQVFKSNGIRVSRYVPLGKEEPYYAVSVLRNFGASLGIFSVLFELPYSENNIHTLEKVLKNYLEWLSKNKQKLAEYNYSAKKLEKEYFLSRIYIIPLHYEGVDKLLKFLDVFDINYYLSTEIQAKAWGFDITTINLKDKDEFKNFIYLDIGVKPKKYDIQARFYIVEANTLSSFILNPIYGESIWNFAVFQYSKNYLPVYIKYE